MRVLLINPKYNTHIIAPHLGLGYLAGSLRQHGHEVTIIDGLRQKVEYSPDSFDWVGITCMSTCYSQMIQEVKRAKGYGLPTIIGGPHVIAEPLTSIKESGADYACAGEGEVVFNSLLDKKAEESINGLLINRNGRIIQNAEYDFNSDLDEYSTIAWDLIDPNSYPVAPHGMVAKKFPLAPIITSRGCPYNCSYCSAPLTSGKKMRFRRISDVLDEIAMLHQVYGVKEIQIEDDNFTINKKRVVEFCEGLIEKKIPVIWSLPNGVRINHLDVDILTLMKRAGCYLIALGIESANQRVLDSVNKNITVEQASHAVHLVKKAGIDVWGFFMIGFPTETLAEVKKTVDFAFAHPFDRVQFTKVTPLPGTSLYELWKKKHSQQSGNDFSRINYYSFEPEWSEVSSKTLSRIQITAHLRYYLKPKNFISIMRRMRVSQYGYLFKRLSNLVN